ncbi:MAG: cupin domain-containing protein [Candidatus Sulfotelmatobacter sp.]
MSSKTAPRLYPFGGQDNNLPEPIRGDRGATILGPRNVAIERENPDLLVSPSTDAGTIPNLKFSFETARNRITPGGWGREVTARELPVATTLAGVNMRLKPGGIRELHWHKEAEWAYMLAGRARITAVDAQGRNFIDDVGVGDLWNFPAGIPHSIQGLAEGCEFLLVFDDGHFSENETFLISDWFVHTPREILAKNFGVPETAFSRLPQDIERTMWILSGDVPGPISEDTVKAPAGVVSTSYSYRMLQQKPIKVPGGQVRIVDSSNFPAASTIAAALVELEPGAMRELHWHPNTDEWQYYLQGRGRMSVFTPGKARTFDYQAGDVGYIPFAYGHYVENTGNEPLRYLEMFRSPHFADLSLNQWMGVTTPKLVQRHLNLDQTTMAALRKDKPILAPASAPHVEHPQLESLPEWPATTVAVLCTMDGEPHAIPVTAPVRAGDHRILFSLAHGRESLARLREHQRVALSILAEDNCAFTACGIARIVQEPMDGSPNFVAVELHVDEIDDHRLPGFAVGSGVSLRFAGDAERSLQQRIEALREIADRKGL